ncbi:MAG: hypothetical protein OIF50_14730 [Flavobacteriaceae bacterium]|nr:hypothetical protein [Flavobacteriaceae bacterium]
MEKLWPYCLSLVLLCTSCNQQQEAARAMAHASHQSQGSADYMNAYARAIELDPSLDAAYRYMSIHYLKTGLPGKWKPLIEQAVARNPKAHIPDRGYLYMWFYRDFEKAIADFNASDSLTPQFTDAPFGHSVDYWRGLCYLGLHHPQKAIHWLDKHIEHISQNTGEDWVEVDAFLFRGISYKDLKDNKNALVNFDKVLKYGEGQYADAHYYKAMIALEQDSLQLAQLWAQKALEDYQNNRYNHRPYVESIRQLYQSDYQRLLDKINHERHKKNIH